MTTHPRRPLSLLFALVLGLVLAVPVVAATPAVRASDAAAPGGRFIVAWRDGAPGRLAINGVKRTESTSVDQRSIVVAKSGQAGKVGAALRADPRVLLVAPDVIVRTSAWPATGAPSDSLYPEQEDLEQIRVPQVWPTTIGDPGVVVAVIDSGVDVTHPDLAGVTVVAPRNEIWNNTDVTDDNGHGTHVAGTIVARTDNAAGIAGIAPGSSLMPIKVLDEFGMGFFSDILDAMDWARTHGADIVNLSLGGMLDPTQAALIQPTFTAARAAGILVIAASGNSGTPIMEYPAGLRGVVSVAAVDQTDLQAEFSTFNRGVDIAAPGVDILSTTAGDYEEGSGTSMASPHVAGVAALIWSARPSLTVAELEAVIRAAAVDLGDPGRDNVYGSGRVDAEAALAESVPSPLPDLEPAPGFTDPLTITFTSPAGRKRQTSRSVNVAWTTSHAVLDGIVVRFSWRIVGGRCPDPDFVFPDDFFLLDFTSPINETGLPAGFCYRWDAVAIDEEGQLAETLSPAITIIDLTKPRIKSRTPSAGATRVSTGTSIKVVFSEPVKGVSGSTLRLKNLSTGLWVRAKVTYNASKRTATINPSKSMFHGRRYAVHVRRGISDPSGNTLTPTSWSFRTRP